MDNRHLMLLIGLIETVVLLSAIIKWKKEKEHTTLDKFNLFFDVFCSLFIIGALIFKPMDDRHITLLMCAASMAMLLSGNIERIITKEHTTLDKFTLFFGSILLLIGIGCFFFT